jgi:hypothetical protein
MHIITPETRKSLQNSLKPHFKVKKGDNLRAVVSNVLNDKDVFAFFAAYLPKGKGLELGKLSLWDDIRVNIPYGLIFNVETVRYEHLGSKEIIPRKVQLYSYHEFGCRRFDNLTIGSYFDNYSRYGTDFKGYPTPKAFVENVNKVLQNPKDHLVVVPLDRKSYY